MPTAPEHQRARHGAGGDHGGQHGPPPGGRERSAPAGPAWRRRGRQPCGGRPPPPARFNGAWSTYPHFDIGVVVVSASSRGCSSSARPWARLDQTTRELCCEASRQERTLPRLSPEDRRSFDLAACPSGALEVGGRQRQRGTGAVPDGFRVPDLSPKGPRRSGLRGPPVIPSGRRRPARIWKQRTVPVAVVAVNGRRALAARR